MGQVNISRFQSTPSIGLAQINDAGIELFSDKRVDHAVNDIYQYGTFDNATDLKPIIMNVLDTGNDYRIDSLYAETYIVITSDGQANANSVRIDFCTDAVQEENLYHTIWREELDLCKCFYLAFTNSDDPDSNYSHFYMFFDSDYQEYRVIQWNSSYRKLRTILRDFDEDTKRFPKHYVNVDSVSMHPELRLIKLKSNALTLDPQVTEYVTFGIGDSKEIASDYLDYSDATNFVDYTDEAKEAGKIEFTSEGFTFILSYVGEYNGIDRYYLGIKVYDSSTSFHEIGISAPPNTTDYGMYIGFAIDEANHTARYYTYAKQGEQSLLAINDDYYDKSFYYNLMRMSAIISEEEPEMPVDSGYHRIERLNLVPEFNPPIYGSNVPVSFNIYDLKQGDVDLSNATNLLDILSRVRSGETVEYSTKSGRSGIVFYESEYDGMQVMMMRLIGNGENLFDSPAMRLDASDYPDGTEIYMGFVISDDNAGGTEILSKIPYENEFCMLSYTGPEIYEWIQMLDEPSDPDGEEDPEIPDYIDGERLEFRRIERLNLVPEFVQPIRNYQFYSDGVHPYSETLSVGDIDYTNATNLIDIVERARTGEQVRYSTPSGEASLLFYGDESQMFMHIAFVFGENDTILDEPVLPFYNDDYELTDWIGIGFADTNKPCCAFELYLVSIQENVMLCEAMDLYDRAVEWVRAIEWTSESGSDTGNADSGSGSNTDSGSTGGNVDPTPGDNTDPGSTDSGSGSGSSSGGSSGSGSSGAHPSYPGGYNGSEGPKPPAYDDYTGATFLFKIDSVDYTQHIKVPTYKVNRMDLYEEWKDANYTEHRDYIRSQVTGDFTMIFSDRNEYLAFIKVLRDKKEADGTTLASLYSNRTDEVITSRYFIDYEPANEMPFYGVRETSGLQITVKER